MEDDNVKPTVYEKHLAGSITPRGALERTRIRTWVERNPKRVTLLAIVTFGAPLLGYFVVGVPGVMVGLMLALIAWLLGPRATKHVRELERPWR
jgi:hypothetical protein